MGTGRWTADEALSQEQQTRIALHNLSQFSSEDRRTVELIFSRFFTVDFRFEN